ncbi:MAG TPA: CPBP family glutamic-type intramembrane protease [Rubricoccaceae bacterium]|nr:CPBP family glutamic-type intramembrane protease [Rubricoccaceae bacterium]
MPASPADEIAALARMTDPRRPFAPGGAAPEPDPDTPKLRPTGYLAVTRTATYGFLAALPLLVLYEVGILFANAGQPGAIRVGADVWLKTLLGALGATGWAAFGLVVLLIGAVVFWAERDRRPPLVPRYFAGIVGEGLMYAVVLAVLVGGTVGLLFGAHAWPAARMAQGIGGMSVPLQLALSIGAGLYEELFFRVLLVGGLFLLAHKVLPRRGQAYAVAAVVGALVFSAVHYMGPLGDPFALPSFTFRFLFGLALNGVFLLRGFALAAWAHALYDVLLVVGGFG